MAQALCLQPELLLVNGEYVPAFDSGRGALPPPAPPPATMDHKKLTGILPEAFRRAMSDYFNNTFAQPIIRVIESNTHTTAPPGTQVHPQVYELLLHWMHLSGLLVWKPGDMRTTPLSQYGDLFCMPVFA